jgi:uncharacterized SAM-binding protein YcdF (DUF218 family)
MKAEAVIRALSRATVIAGGLGAFALAFGFVLFATSIMRDKTEDTQKADGIVVLTGGDTRIQAGAKLLAEGRGKRLLISGVNRKVGREEIRHISGLNNDLYTCCVDLGYEALDTVGNADETRTWARTNGYHRLIVVTSTYHMPRSLAELALAMQDIEFIAHTVTPRSFPETGWWLHVRTTRLLLSEYLKYLPAVARLATQRVMGWGDTGPIAAAPDKRADG